MSPSGSDPMALADEACRLAQTGHPGDALPLFQQALAHHPDRPGVRSNYAAALTTAGYPDKAAEQLHTALQQRPDFPEAWNNLGNALWQACRIEEAYKAYSRAVQLRPAAFPYHSNRLLTLRYRDFPAAWQHAAIRDYRQALASHPLHPASARPPPASAPSSAPPRRIACLSPDFRLHSVAFFLEPLLDQLRRSSSTEIHLYSDVRHADALTARFRQLANQFHPVSHLTDEELLTKIRSDRIDVLIDLCGHFQYNRQPVFAARAAPLQLAWLGFPGSTHTPNIDFRCTDAVVDPPEDPARAPAATTHPEPPPLRLPMGYHVYRPPQEAPPVAPSPCGRTGELTFACFNNAPKISPAMADLWGRLLVQCPRSRLLLKARAFNDPAVRERILSWILRDKKDLHPDRVRFLPRTVTFQEHLKAYHEADLALDTHPYSGTTTTCEALWMGVPSLTLTGGAPQSRVTASLLQHAGLPQFIARSPREFLLRAAAFTERPQHLASLRSSLRAHLQKTPLLNEAAFAEQFIKALHRAFREENSPTA